MRFKGRTILVVGGSDMVGGALGSSGATESWSSAIAKRLVSEDAEVIMLDHDAAWLADLRAQIDASGGNVETIVTEIFDYDALAHLASDWVARGRVIDGLVTNYFDTEWGNIEECDIAAFERVAVRILVGPVKAVKAFLPLLKAGRGRSIVHLGSVDGIYGAPLVPAYSTCKGGLAPLTHVMAFEFAKYDIRVNLLASCATVEMPEVQGGDDYAWKGFPGASLMARLNAATPLKRYGPLSDWAGAVSFLLCDDSAYVTGTTLVVDCGRTMVTPGYAGNFGG